VKKRNMKGDKLKKRPGKVKVDSEAGKIPISIRMDAYDISALRDEADRLGIPYQTLIGSIVHRYVTGELLDKREISLNKPG
jgi:predicted DNA binding CopG/RHH family protein